MFENFERQGARAGKTVAFEITKLRNPDGSHPIIHLEHLGSSNGQLKQFRISRAGAKGEPDLREFLRCAARKLEQTTRADGSLATDTDLPAFIKAIPDSVVESILQFAFDESNFSDYQIEAVPTVIAEK